MSACDIILAKPSGLTSTELVVENISAIFTNPIPGYENYNANFFKERSMAFVSQNADETMKYIDILLNDKKQVRKMKSNQSKYTN